MSEKNKKYECPIPEETREHIKAARQARRHSIRALFPEKFLDQRRTARKEMLMAARSMIDHALERYEA